MKTKKLNKRVLALFMTVMMCMSGFQVSVFATEDSPGGETADTTVTETVTSTPESTETETSAEPTESEQPTEPETPTEPTKPEQSTEPTDTTPETSENPEAVLPTGDGSGSSATPEESTEPGQPIESVTPEEPMEPEQPTEPVTPEEPMEPEQPTEPVTPEEPTKPEQPAKPTESAEPETSETPEEPDDSENPEPTIPAEPSKDGEAAADPETLPPANGGGGGTSATPDEIAKTENDLNDANENVEKIKGEKADADAKLQAAQDAADKAAEELNAAISKASSAETAFAAAQSALANAVTDEEKAQAQFDLDAAQTELDQAKAQLASAEKAVEDAKQLLEEAGLAAEDAAARFETAKNLADELKVKLNALKAEQPKEEPAADYNSALEQIPEQITSENLLGEADEKVIETYKYFAEMDEETQQNLISEDIRFSNAFISVVDAYRNLASEDRAQAAEKFSTADIDINKLVETDDAFNAVTAEEITAENILPASETLVSAAKLFVELSTPLQALWQPKVYDKYGAVANAYIDFESELEKTVWENVGANLGKFEAILSGGYNELGDAVVVSSLEDLKKAIFKGADNIEVKTTINVNENFELKPSNEKNVLNISYHKGFSNTNNEIANMFKVAANCTLIIAEGVTLTGRKDNTGSIIFVDGGTLEMNGGTITGNHKGTPLNESKTDYSTIKNKEYTYNGAGVYIESGNFIMNSGIIKDNHTIYYEYGGLPYTTQENQKIINKYTFFDVNNKYYRPVGQGGGVYIKAGNFTMIGGTIEDNHAGEGGGIFVDENATFIMGDEKNNTSTGSVNDNIAYLGEGGGIYVRSNIDKNSTITHGNIIGNKTMAVEDLGGGGIYVESGYKLTIKNALITNNVAAGLGGGIAACVHGKTSIVNDDGAAIYDNKSLYSKDDKTYEGIQYGVGFVRNQNMSRYAQFNYGNKDWYDLIDSYTKWKENSNFQNAAQDFFSAGSNAEVTNNDTQIPGAIISGEMTGGGYANWSGYSVNNEASNSADSYQGWSISESDKINKTNNSLIYSGKLAALTSSPSDKDKSKATSSAKVIIKGNKSINTHGGGIATNGILVLGTVKSDKTIEGFNFGLDQKAIKKLEGDELEADKFEFELVAGDSNNNGAYVSEKEAIASAKNSANGDINFQITAKELSDFDELDPNKTYTFYMREKVDPKVSDIDFDKSVYKIVVKLKHDKDESVTVGSTSDNNYMIKYYIGEIESIEKFHDRNGNEITDESDKNVSNNEPQFTNIKGSGKFTIKKVNADNTEESLSNAVFGLFLNADAESPFKTGITNKAGTVEFDNLIKGNYILKETIAPTGYKINSTVWTVTVAEDYNVTITDAENNNWSFSNDSILTVKDEPIKGTIQVTKEFKFDHEDLADFNSDRDNVKKKTFTFNLYKGTDILSTPVDTANVVLNSDGAYIAEFEPQPYGTYTIVEVTNDNMNGDYYQWDGVSYSSKDGNITNGTVVTIDKNNCKEDSIISITATNNYKLALGSLQIEKHVYGLTLDEFKELNKFDELKFNITGPSYSEENGKDILTIKKSKFEEIKDVDGKVLYLKGTSNIVTGLIPGKYTITENLDTAEVKDHALSHSVADEITVNPIFTNMVTESNITTAQFNNNYAKNSIGISKVLNGGEKTFAGKVFKFKISDSTGQQYGDIVEVTAGETKYVYGLPAGKYTIEEVYDPNEAYEKGYAWEVLYKSVVGKKDGTTINSDNNIVDIEHGGNAFITVTNTYDPTSLTIKKDVTGGPASASADKEYVFNVTNENGYNKTVTIKGTGETTLEGLLPGTYTITEQDARIGGYRWSTNISVNGGEAVAGVSAKVTLENPGDDAVVVVNNTYTRIPSDDPLSTPDPKDPPKTPDNPTTPSDPSTPNTPENPTAPVVDVPDPETPLVDVPEPDVPLANIPEPDTPLSELPEDDVPLANIPDEETPLVELPEDIPLAAMPPEEVPSVDIIDEDVPKTGDMGFTMLWMMLCLLALSGITASSVPYLRRRRK